MSLNAMKSLLDRGQITQGQYDAYFNKYPEQSPEAEPETALQTGGREIPHTKHTNGGSTVAEVAEVAEIASSENGPDTNGEFTLPCAGALWMASLGLPQIPLKGKGPFMRDWPAKASCDPIKIKEWDMAHSGCNFGSVAHNREFFIFETDSPTVKTRFEKTGEKFTSKLVIESSPGREHRYYRWVDGIENIAQGVNFTQYGDYSIRVDNEQCVSPGSFHPRTGKQYRVVRQGIPEIPSAKEIQFWNSERIKNPTEKNTSENEWRNPLLDNPKELAAAIKKICDGDGNKIPRGGHDTTLCSIGGALRQIGLGKDEILPLLIKTCEERCTNFGTDYKQMAEKIAASVARYPIGPDTTVYVGGVPAGARSSVSVGASGTSEVEIRVVEESNLIRKDMPEDCLGSGLLAEICRNHMGNFPRSYAFPALLTVAGSMIKLPEQTSDESVAISAGYGNLTNLYTCLTGEIGSGKSQAIRYAVGHLNLNPRNYTDTKAGSIEGLLRKIAKMMGPSIGMRNQIMVDLDEWSHLFKKAGIENAAFMEILNSGFNKTRFHLTVAKGEQINVDCALSIIGGMPTDKIEECFGSSSVGGFHDRFLFGVCPTINPFEYQPFEVSSAAYQDPFIDLNPSRVTIDKDVWKLAAEWKRADQALGRSVEVTIRCGVIIAAFDHRLTFTGRDLQDMRPFLDYQVRARKLITPNPGATNDAKMTNSILAWLNAHAGSGEWTTQRSLKKGIKSQLALLGPMAYNNSIRNLTFINAIELGTKLNLGTRPSDIIRLIKGS